VQLGLAVSGMLKGYTTTAASIITAMLKSVTRFTMQAGGAGAAGVAGARAPWVMAGAPSGTAVGAACCLRFACLLPLTQTHTAAQPPPSPGVCGPHSGLLHTVGPADHQPSDHQPKAGVPARPPTRRLARARAHLKGAPGARVGGLPGGLVGGGLGVTAIRGEGERPRRNRDQG
jgi:hypothetical protein